MILSRQREPAELFMEGDLLALLKGFASLLAYFQINKVTHGKLMFQVYLILMLI